MVTNYWREGNEIWREHRNIWREGNVLGGKRIAIDLRRSGIERLFSETDNVGTSSQDIIWEECTSQELRLSLIQIVHRLELYDHEK